MIKSAEFAVGDEGWGGLRGEGDKRWRMKPKGKCAFRGGRF